MEKSLKLIRFPLIIAGLDIFNGSNKVRNTILRLISYLSIVLTTSCLGHAILLDKNLEFADQVFLTLANQAYIIGVIQSTYFWYYRDEVYEIFDEIKNLHKAREDDWVQVHSQPLYDKCTTFLQKLCK